MKLAYLILCHKNADQVKRMIDRLNTIDTLFVLHVSLSCEKGFFEEIRRVLSPYPNAYFCKREDGTHNSFGTVLAALNGLRELVNNKLDFDYAILLSGQDYPIKSNTFIHSYFDKNRGKDFILHFPIDPPKESSAFKNKAWYPWWSNQQLYRVQKYWTHFEKNGKRFSLPDDLYKGGLITSLQTFIKTIFSKDHRGLKNELRLFVHTVWPSSRKTLPEGVNIYGGYAWWAFQNSTALYLLSFFDANPDFNSFFEHTLIPDEMYFQTVLMNSKYRDNVVSEFIKESVWDWEGHSGTHPLIYGARDFDKLKNSDKLFARKFDTDVDYEILDAIDKKILK